MKNINPQKNLIFKIILFIVFFFIWQSLVVAPLRRKLNKKNDTTKDFTQIETELLQQEAEQIVGKDIVLENDYLKIILNTKGLVLDNVLLKKYTQSIDDKTNIRLLNNQTNEKYYITSSWLNISNAGDVPNQSTIWTLNKELSTNNKLVFEYTNNNNVKFVNTLFLDNKYLLNVEQEVVNGSDTIIKTQPIFEITKNNIFKRTETNVFNGGIGYFNTGKVEEIKPKKLKKGNVEFDSFNWAGFTSKYWQVNLINKDNINSKINFLEKDGLLKMQYTTSSYFGIRPNDKKSHDVQIFLGVKNREILNEYKKLNSLKLFDRSIDYGMLFLITKPLSLMLNALNKIIGNFGFSIIIFTILVKLALYPMVKKSTVSMMKMKKIQPQMIELQKKYGNDKVAFQKAVMKLYSESKVNPMSGILPLFIQIPVFFALYKVLSISLEMRQAPFIWFLRDLSVADPTNIINLFGLLPIKNPVLHIGILPVLMAVTMIIQQKVMELSQKGETKTESMEAASNASKFMPWIFLFIFAGFPSGLLLYWILSNIISIIQQLYIEYKYKNSK